MTHQPCIRCEATDKEAFREVRAKVCEGCRPEYELERNGRTCYGCFRRLPRDQFPLGDGRYRQQKKGKRIRRRKAYCFDCTARNEEDAKQRAIENRATWKDYRGRIVRRCSGCRNVKPLDKENFYVSHPNMPADKPEHWDYRCKRCRIQMASDYNRDKRLKGDEQFLEQRREAQRRYVERHPQAMKEARDRYRDRKRRGEVVPIRERRHPEEVAPRIPRGPFLEWVEATLPKYPGLSEFCELIDVPPRTLYRLRTDGEEKVELDLVDRALQREGGTMLHDIYPNLYDYDEDEVAA